MLFIIEVVLASSIVLAFYFSLAMIFIIHTPIVTLRLTRVSTCYINTKHYYSQKTF